MASTKWTPLALSELEEILFQIAVRDRRPETAEKNYWEIREAVEMHARKNLPGHRHTALPQGWLYLMHKRWLIAYETDGDELIVHRIVDGARDLPNTF